MKVEELRIGNYVLARGALAVVKSIDENHIGYSKSKKGEERIPIKLIQPIPITEESLVKFGFDECYKTKQGILKQYSKSRIKFDVSNSGNIYYSHKNIPIYHVHQLQNLYWCLCGKELEIIT